MTYMASCEGNCTDFDPTGKNVWFKVAEQGYTGIWTGEYLGQKLTRPHFATLDMATNNSRWSVPIPTELAPGQYLVRHEVMALHKADHPGLAEFYPSCVQVNVVGSGNKLPSDDLVAFPGAYSATDPGILFSLYNADGTIKDVLDYTIPGPPVYDFSKAKTVAAAATSPSSPTTTSSTSLPKTFAAASSSPPRPAAAKVATTSPAKVDTTSPAATYVSSTAVSSLGSDIQTVASSTALASIAAMSVVVPGSPFDSPFSSVSPTETGGDTLASVTIVFSSSRAIHVPKRWSIYLIIVLLWNARY